MGAEVGFNWIAIGKIGDGAVPSPGTVSGSLDLETWLYRNIGSS